MSTARTSSPYPHQANLVTPDGVHADRRAGIEHPVPVCHPTYTEALHNAEQAGIDPRDVDAAIRPGVDTADQQRRLETTTRA